MHSSPIALPSDRKIGYGRLKHHIDLLEIVPRLFRDSFRRGSSLTSKDDALGAKWILHMLSCEFMTLPLTNCGVARKKSIYFTSLRRRSGTPCSQSRTTHDAHQRASGPFSPSSGSSNGLTSWQGVLGGRRWQATRAAENCRRYRCCASRRQTHGDGFSERIPSHLCLGQYLWMCHPWRPCRRRKNRTLRHTRL